jgi:hypothetical protein
MGSCVLGVPLGETREPRPVRVSVDHVPDAMCSDPPESAPVVRPVVDEQHASGVGVDVRKTAESGPTLLLHAVDGYEDGAVVESKHHRDGVDATCRVHGGQDAVA